MDVASFGYPDLINHYDPENGDTFQRYSDIRLGNRLPIQSLLRDSD